VTRSYDRRPVTEGNTLARFTRTIAALAAARVPAIALLSAQAGRLAADIPLVPGLTFVLAVHNPNTAPEGSRIAQGDYEMVVGVTGVSSDRVRLSTRIEAEDERKQELQVDVERQSTRRAAAVKMRWSRTTGL
jgi:hypothetical protein